MKKIVAMTATRSDYNLVRELYKLLHNDKDIDLSLVVSGAHLSSQYGYSFQQIEDDGFDILIKVETLISSDSKASRLKTASLLMVNTIDIIANHKPDLILIAGDREDVIVGALIGAYLEIPTMHLFAGDHVRDGHVDNPVRHATSKLATVCIASIKEHEARLLKLGEPKDRVFCTGSIALDKFVNTEAMSKDEIRKVLHITSGFEKFAFLIFHPIPEERDYANEVLETILRELENAGINTFVGYPNTDPDNYKLIEVIERYKSNKNFYIYRNLGSEIFLSIFKHSDFIIGNSSAGILEAASIPIPAVNVGIRQASRYAEGNVLWTGISRKEIRGSIKKAMSKDFKDSICDMVNPYGDGNSSQKVYEIIKNNDFNKSVLKKEDILVE